MDWKAPPADEKKLWLNKSLEIQLLIACNWSCIACDQFSQMRRASFVRMGTMTEQQIRHFVEEMHEANAYIGRIRLVGGEPTIAPLFETFVSILHEGLVVPGHVGRLEVITNGTRPERIRPVSHLLEKVRVSGEASKQKTHVANLVNTPASLGYEGKMCNAPSHCGWSLNYWGYYPCSSGAGLSRFHDWSQWQRLRLPRQATLLEWPDLQQLCNHCYHGLREEDKVRCGTGTLPGQLELNKPSESNQQIINAWMEGKHPSLAIYGE